MTDPLLTLDGSLLTADPGGQVRVGVTVSNPGNLVEGYRLDVVGDGVSGWAEVVPPEVSVYPKEEVSAVVVITPPTGGAAPSGVWPFGVRARSLVDPEGRAVVEGKLEVGKVFGLQGKLVPVTSSGRWRGRHVLHFSNWGNTAVKLRLDASDADNALGYLVRPRVIDLPVGAQATARLWVRGRRPFLRGAPVRVPFTVVAERAGAAAATTPLPTAAIAMPDRPVVDGALHQKPVLSRGVLTLGVAALVLALGGVAWGATRKGPGDRGYVDQFPPDKPTNLRADATGPTTINLTWDGVDRVRQWQIQSFLKPDLKVFGATEVNRVQTSTTVQGLPASKEVCFRVVAQGFGVDSPPSEEACTSTLRLPPSVTPTPLETLPPPSGAASPLASAAESPAVPPPAVPPPAGPSSSGPSPSRDGGPSPTATTTTPTPTPTTSSATSGPVAALTGKWVNIGFATAAADRADPRLQAARTKLLAVDPDAGLIFSGDPEYADLQPVDRRRPTPSWLVIMGRYDTEQQAQQACPPVLSLTGICISVQPDPF